MKYYFLASVFLLGPLTLAAQTPPSIKTPKARGFYVDPVSQNRVWRVTDSSMCPRGGHHEYSYWPVWNQDGTHLLVQCLSRGENTALLVRDSDLKVVGDALQGAPSGIRAASLFWSWTDPNVFYIVREDEVWKWNPFQRKGKLVHRFAGTKVGSAEARRIRLAYVSFDDRYLLLEFQGPNRRSAKPTPWDNLGLATFDMQTGQLVGLLDVTLLPYYDEAVFTKDNFVWVRANGADNKPESFRYTLDLQSRIRVAEGGHHAHGLLPDGTPVAVKAEPSRSCPTNSMAGIPGKAWKPYAQILDERVDTSGALRFGPLASELYRVACNIPGQHQLQHFSWNNVQRDQFFSSSLTYNDFAADPLANAILRVHLEFDASGKIVGDKIDVLAHHRSTYKGDYWAYPRVSCNQQGTRCLFDSTMTVATDNRDFTPHIYTVDVPKD